MAKIIAVISDPNNSDQIRVFFDGPVVLDRRESRSPFTPQECPRVDWPEGATHFWYSEAGTDWEPNGFPDDELGAFMWGEWVLSMQDEWSKKP